MPPLIRALSPRDAVLILIGAISMHFFATVAPLTSQSIVITAGFHQPVNKEASAEDPEPQNDQTINGLLVPALPELNGESEGKNKAFGNTKLSGLSSLPETTILEHAPGWTLFRDVYMENGTLLLLSSSPSSFPEARYMTSTGLAADNTPENKAQREPTQWNIDTVSPEEAHHRWGNLPSTRRVWSVDGNTLLFNDPPQFLRHYYHFCAELLFGTWSIWTGAVHPEPPPPIHRIIFPHSPNEGWRDRPGFNGYFLRAAFPSLTVEVDADWEDRVEATSPDIYSGIHRAWHFPYLLLADRSAAFRGDRCGPQNQRVASEPVDALIARSKLDKYGYWWRPVRNAVWNFAGVTTYDKEGSAGDYALDDKPQSTSMNQEFEETDKFVITYISRQSTPRRRLIHEDHEVLVKNLEALVERKNAALMNMTQAGGVGGKEWELNVVSAEKLTKDEQVQLAARTTILLGVHGNGLSHLILMPRTNVSAVIEMFYPGGFAHDYEWTTRTLGMGYFGVWNDTYFTDDTPDVRYPEGFQGNKIPAYGPTIANIIEKRIAGEL